MNIQQFMGMYQQFRNNPMQILSQRFNIPQDVGQDPNAILQHLINSGQVSQEQVNRLSQMKNMFNQRY